MTNTTTTWPQPEVGLGRPPTIPATPRRLRRGVAVAALGALAAAGAALGVAVALDDGGTSTVPAVEVDGAVRPAASFGDRMSVDALERRAAASVGDRMSVDALERRAAAGGATAICRSGPMSADAYERCVESVGG